jgi:hypothetical protein
MRKWIAAAAQRAAHADHQAAASRNKLDRYMRKIKKSKMRSRASKYGSLNAWEVAYFRGEYQKADYDGDGLLALDEVYDLLMKLGEEPKLSQTWDILDANAGSDDLVSLEEFLVFISIKRNDDAQIALEGGLTQYAGKQSAYINLRRDRARMRMRQRNTLFGKTLAMVTRRLDLFRRFAKRLSVERLPQLGVFGRDGIGETRSRSLQHFIFSRAFWCVEISVILCSAILVSEDINVMVHDLRTHAGVESNSDGSLAPSWLISAFDSAFMFVAFAGILIKMITEGPLRSLSNPWNAFDLTCLLVSLLRILLTNWKRTMLSFSAIRIFMLLSRFKELKLLSESILRALPNVLVTMISLLIIWLMFGILGVALFGGGTHQCARLNETNGFPGCGVELGSRSFSGENECRYALAPLPPPKGVIPGVTNSSQCGCTWIDGKLHCDVISVDGEQLIWARSYPSFDTTSQAMLALLQISTLDGWANIMYFAMDVTSIDHQPARENNYLYPICYFLLFIIFGVLFATNVFVGVVIDEFNRIRRVYDGLATLTEEQMKWVNTQRLILRLKPETTTSFEPSRETPWRQKCFRLVHDDKANGRPANAPSGVKYYGKSFEEVVKIAICLNVVALTLWQDPMDPSTYYVYEALNYAFVLAFSIEAAIKIVAHTFRAYIRYPLNVFDFFLVVFSICASLVTITANLMGIDLTSSFGMSMRWMRCVRAFRIIRLANVSKSLVKMMRTMLFAAPSIANITVGIFLVTAAYAQFGMSFLGTLMYDNEGSGFSRHANFETSFRAFSSLVRMATGDSWSALLADAVNNPHVPGIEPPPHVTVYCFFIFYVGIMQWVLISIFVAIILEYFNESNSDDGVDIKQDDVIQFQRKWLEFDVGATSYIRTIDLGLLLFSCHPPLVGVQLEERDGYFFEGSKYVRAGVSQIDQMLIELDVPEHGGSVHFLEVLLALLQRVTGVINEEAIMSQLLQMHPQYVKSVLRMPNITGSTSDGYLRGEVMSHMRRGLEATGLHGELRASACADEKPDGEGPGQAAKKSMRRKSAFARKQSLIRSFTRKNVPLSPDEQKVQAEIETEQRRNSLAQCAVTNIQQRRSLVAIQEEAKIRSAARAAKRRGSASLISAVLGKLEEKSPGSLVARATFGDPDDPLSA